MKSRQERVGGEIDGMESILILTYLRNLRKSMPDVIVSKATP